MIDEINYNLKPPKKIMLQMYSSRLGKILFNISLLALIISLCPPFSWFIIALIAIIGVLIILCTIGLVFVVVPDFISKFQATIDYASKISQFLLSILPMTISIAFVCSLLSIIFLLYDKNNSHKARIFIAILSIVVSIILFIIFVLGMKV
ncbi:MAG: hypothetical protein ACI35W_05005 [Anaeroplasmataceae bacterium]